MAHNVLIGVFAWLAKLVDGALLTVIGYSVNDSVVVFDRVREMWGAKGDAVRPGGERGDAAKPCPAR